jgi:hypothetical protein
MTIMVMTGGEGRPDVGIGDFFDIFFGGNDISDDRSNRVAGFDLRFNLPGYQLYMEYGGEDEAGGFPSKNAGLIGLYWPEFWPQILGDADLRIEYADLAPTSEIAGAWYRHGTYADGYTYDGRILGHHVGGGGRDLFAEVSFGMGDEARGRVGVDIEERGKYVQPEIEKHTQLMAGWEGPVSLIGMDTKIDFSVAIDQVQNREYTSGEEATDGYVKLEIKGEI